MLYLRFSIRKKLRCLERNLDFLQFTKDISCLTCMRKSLSYLLYHVCNSCFLCCSHESCHTYPEMVQEILGKDGDTAEIYVDHFPKHRIRWGTRSSQGNIFLLPCALTPHRTCTCVQILQVWAYHDRNI